MIPFTLHALVQRHRVLKVVSSGAKVGVFNDSPVLSGAVSSCICRRETLRALDRVSSLNLFLEAGGSVFAVSGSVNIFSINPRDKASVARDALIQVFVGGTIHPSIRIFTSVTNRQHLVVSLLRCFDRI